MAQAMVHRSCARLRSAIEDAATKRWKLDVRDLQDMAEMLEEIDEAALEGAEKSSLQGTLQGIMLTGSIYETWLSWLKRVRKACYDITDMVDELQSMTAGEIKKELLPSKKNRMAMASKMKEAKEEVRKIREESRNFVSKEAKAPPGPPEYEDDDSKILGRGEFVEKIVAAVQSYSGAIIIIPIVGEQGIGKTSVAGMVFRHAHFVQEYNLRVWVNVSPEFNLRKIAESIISPVSVFLPVSGGVGERNFHGNGDGKMEDIISRLHGGMKVLIVLDDIQEQEHVQLGNLKRMLISAAAGNIKVVVIATTAIEGVAREICTGVTSPYYLPPLGDPMMWTIIKRESRVLPPLPPARTEFERIGMEIARSCRGLPAAASKIGLQLRGMDAANWRLRTTTPKLYAGDSTFIPTMADVGGSFVRFMMRRYADIPRSMRLCFAYCAVLFSPAGRCVAKDEMVHQWIALDLVQPSGGRSAAQVAEEYIKRLLEMCFLRAPSAGISGKHGGKGATLLTMPFIAHGLARFMMFDELVVQDGASWQKQEHCRYAVLTDTGMKLSSALPAQLRALRLMDCSKMELSEDSFSIARCLRILELKESSMQRLHGSICGLKHLGYLNLSGSSQLFTLPESFGYLVTLLHIDLSGCSGLVKLPQSFGKLINLMHVTFSGCSGLANLPESFGDLTKLLHVDLSRCCGLMNLPKSFRNLTSLVHLDLSFWSCFEGIQTALGDLTSLQHLNLSHPCCYLAQHRSHLQGLEDVIGKLTKLQYLNLSMFLNPIFFYQSKIENHKYIELCISGLPSLEHLDLSHNIFLPDLPESLSNLSNLHTLDLSGCIRLKKIYRWVGEIECLKLSKCRGLESCIFVVHADDSSSSLVQLEHVNCQELEIRCVEKAMCTEEAQMIRLGEKHKVERLKLSWTTGSQGSVEDSALLEVLQPPQSLKCLELHGYNSETCLPSWWRKSACHLLHLLEVTMEDFPRCRSLPPLGMLPNLQKLIIRRMVGITRIDVGDLSGGNREAFGQLSKFTIDDMGSLEEFNTSAYSSGDEEFIMFPFIDELVIKSCPKLRFGPYPPRAQMLLVSSCDRVMSSAGMEGLPSTCSTSTQQRQTKLVVEGCKLPLGDWSLLHRLHGLHTLQTLCFSHCDTGTVLPNDLGELTSLQELQIISCKLFHLFPESMQHLTSLRSMQLADCKQLRKLPEWLGNLTSLQKLTIDRCPGVKSLPRSIEKLTNLKDLHILGCRLLKSWCESEENKKMLSHIPNQNYEYVA